MYATFPDITKKYEADTADFGFLHNGYIESILSGPDCGNISAWA